MSLISNQEIVIVIHKIQCNDTSSNRLPVGTGEEEDWSGLDIVVVAAKWFNMYISDQKMYII